MTTSILRSKSFTA